MYEGKDITETNSLFCKAPTQRDDRTWALCCGIGRNYAMAREVSGC